jgi:membrane associated rhomboid family serine protease
MTGLRTAAQRSLAEQWALVLNSQGLNCAIQRGGEGWILVVRSEDAERGLWLLEQYDEENRPREEKPVEVPAYGSTWIGVWLALSIAAFHALATSPELDIDWSGRGSASADLILRGEWWRTVTALTLHVDFQHVLANSLSLGVFATAVCYAIGPGFGTALILLSGVAGNALNAWVHGADHVSVGASTAVFGAVGLLAGQSLVTHRRSGLRGYRAWAPLAAGLGLLAMMGTGGGRTDIAAHVFGLLSGGVLGLLAALAIPRPPSKPMQAALLTASAAAVALCWTSALL